jgi:peroxiredoxin
MNRSSCKPFDCILNDKHMKRSLKRKINILLTGITLLLSSVCFANGDFDYQVMGNIRGLKNDSVIFFIRGYDQNGKLKADTIITVAKNDKFLINERSGALRDAYVVVGGFRARKNFTLFIEKGVIQINGDIDSLDNVSITGTPGNEEYTIYKKRENDIYGHIRLLQGGLKQAGNRDDSAKIFEEMNAWRDSIRVGRIDFITTHPGSPASAIYLYVLQDNIPVGQLESLYNNLSQPVKQVSFVRAIPEKILARKRSEIGKAAPEFAATDINGKSFKLADYRGKYILLEFWASWCVPCRAENPGLLKAYKKYSDRGFVVVGISLDDKKEKWIKAIQEDQLPWIHISDLNAFDNKVAKLYGVQPIPDNFLIDPQGKIIARGLRGEQLEERLAGAMR